MAVDDRPWQHHSEAELLEARRYKEQLLKRLAREQQRLEDIGAPDDARAKFEHYEMVSAELHKLNDEFAARRNERASSRRNQDADRPWRHHSADELNRHRRSIQQQLKEISRDQRRLHGRYLSIEELMSVEEYNNAHGMLIEIAEELKDRRQSRLHR